MNKLKTTRREFMKNSIVTGLTTGYVMSMSKNVFAGELTPSHLKKLKKRDGQVLNQANMFDLPEAYSLVWGRTVHEDGRVSL